jgi:Mg2+/Co2+ transporter CorC
MKIPILALREKLRLLRTVLFFGCVTFSDVLNQSRRSIGKGTLDTKGQLSFEIAAEKPYQVVAELTSWGAFGAAFNLRIQKDEVTIFNGTRIGYTEFTHYTEREGKLKIAGFSKAKENSVDGILNHFFCTPMRTLKEIQ